MEKKRASVLMRDGSLVKKVEMACTGFTCYTAVVSSLTPPFSRVPPHVLWQIKDM